MLGARLNMSIKRPAKRGIVMTKDEFLDQFAQLNTDIESALSMQDFERARLIDGARREMLQKFATYCVLDCDKAFFESLEQCAADNARAITVLNAELQEAQRIASKQMRGLSGYRAQQP